MAKFNIMSQFLKDFSFENPNVPELFFKQENSQAKLEINIDIQIKGSENNLFLVDLITKVHSKLEANEKTVFLIESTYSGLVQMEEEKDEEVKKRTLLIDVPTLLFPAVRSLITRMTSESGLAPFTMQPVDFAKLYEQRSAQKEAKKEEAK
ncbi:MAG: protein-export chaperone SecB [Alphaproteobacteria bacterium]|nr:protein-export chaperone SecB [Alphaproteobacteria bacterium]